MMLKKAVASSTVSSSPALHRWSLSSLMNLGLQDSSLLVKDVAVRLDQQLSRCQQLLNWVAATSQKTTSNHSKNGVIQTSKLIPPYWWKGYTQEKDLQEEKALKNLHNLEYLHKATSQLCRELMIDNNSRHSIVSSKLEQIRSRHALTVENLAELVIGLRRFRSPKHCAVLEQAVMQYLRGRLGIQLLCDHFVGLYKKKLPYGSVSVDLPLEEALQDAITEARHNCEAHFLHSPEVILLDTKLQQQQITTIRPWLHYSLMELLKNALAATVEQHHDKKECSIYIALEQPLESVLDIHILDQGGGFEGNVDDLFRFGVSGLTPLEGRLWDRLDDQQTYAMTRSPLRGLGVGLTLSKLMMQHFGGDISLLNRTQSRERQGTSLDPGCSARIRLNLSLDEPERECDNVDPPATDG